MFAIIDDASFNFTGGTPEVKGNDVTFELLFGGGVVRATCALVIGSQVLEETDCKIIIYVEDLPLTTHASKPLQ